MAAAVLGLSGLRATWEVPRRPSDSTVAQVFDATADSCRPAKVSESSLSQPLSLLKGSESLNWIPLDPFGALQFLQFLLMNRWRIERSSIEYKVAGRDSSGQRTGSCDFR